MVVWAVGYLLMILAFLFGTINDEDFKQSSTRNIMSLIIVGVLAAYWMFNWR